MKNFFLVLSLLLVPNLALSQIASLLTDTNQDGQVTVAAFGDSITRGVGDFIPAGAEIIEVDEIPESEAGYPLRVETALSVPVSNLGSAGERLVREGIFRFAALIPNLKPDVVIVSGGSNDAFELEGTGPYLRTLQTMANIAHASGTVMALSTIPPTCCDRGGLEFFIDSYNNQIKAIASINELRVADAHRAFINTCGLEDCHLLNRPEGLHPNQEGYDVFGEVVISMLLGIDIFSTTGQDELKAAIGVESLKTVPSA